MMASTYAQKYAEAIWGRLAADSVQAVDDESLDASLSPCVCGPMLLKAAIHLRDTGDLYMRDGLVRCSSVADSLKAGPAPIPQQQNTTQEKT
jgi:hypothetical protein